MMKVKNLQIAFFAVLSFFFLIIFLNAADNFEQFKHLRNIPKEEDGVVFFWGECQNNDYTPQPLASMSDKEYDRFALETTSGLNDRHKINTEGSPRLVIRTLDEVARFSLKSISRTVKTKTIFVDHGYENDNLKFVFRVYEIPQTEQKTTYVFKYMIDGEEMSAQEIVYSGEECLPVVHFKDMQIYIANHESK